MVVFEYVVEVLVVVVVVGELCVFEVGVEVVDVV